MAFGYSSINAALIDVQSSIKVDRKKIRLEELQRGMEQALAGGPVMKVLVDLTA